MSEATLESLGDARFRVSGALSFDTARALWERARELFAELTAEQVEIDLQQVERVDSAGLALLVAWSRWAQGEGRSLRFTHGPAQVMALAQANRLASVLDLEAA